MRKSSKEWMPPRSYDEFGENADHGLQMRSEAWYSSALECLPLCVHLAMDVERRGKCYCHHHCYSGFALEWLLDGKINYEFDGVPYVMHPGEIALLQHRRDSLFFNPPAGYYRRRVLIFTGSALGIILENLKLSNCWHLPVSDPEAMARRFGRFETLLKRKTPGSELKISLLSYELLLYLAELRRSADNGWPEALQRALSLINGSYAEPLTPRSIAAAAGVSVSGLFQLFRDNLGMSPMAYVTQLRINVAASILVSENVTVKEAAWRVGYDNPLYFSTVFSRVKGSSPRQYRRQFAGY